VRVVVFGAGAIGGLFGALLQRAGHEVLLVAREPDVVAIRANGLRIEGTTTGTFEIPVVDALTDGLETEAVLLTVKAPGLAEAAREIGRRLRPVPPVLALQNGLGIEATVEKAWDDLGVPVPAGTLTRAIHTVPATREAPGVIRNAGTGEVLLGSSDAPGRRAQEDRFETLLHSGGLAVRRVPDLDREIWRKVILNAAINPVTADHGIRNGELARDPWRGQAEKLLWEAVAVAAAEGFTFDRDEIERDLWRIVRATAGNRSSMLQDLDRGRTTEIDAIVGELLRSAERRGVEVPQLTRIHARIAARAYSGPSGADHPP
jgi:2-dehydropantoate 2-reductase